MNKWFLAFLLTVFCVPYGYGESFLKSASFPTTFNDLSFTEKMEFKAEDYELYRPIYDDKTGNCIENCVYYGINIKQETEKSENDTRLAVEKSTTYEKTSKTLPIDTQNIVSTVSVNMGHCANRNTDVPSGQKVPWGEPVKSLPRISSPYGPRKLEGKQSFHDGIDYAVVVGTPVYTPADGRVVRIINDSTCGRGVRIQHNDGTQTIYCHLSEQMVQSGDYVGAGCQIGKSGNTGHSTGAHLHYGMRDANNNKIDPSQYTKRAN